MSKAGVQVGAIKDQEKKSIPAWNEDREKQLLASVGTIRPVPADAVIKAAEDLETSQRSIASKLRKMGEEVVSMAKDTSKKYTEAEEKELSKFLLANSGKFTYAELSEKVLKKNPRTPKQIQGKILSMELTEHVKAAPVAEVVKKYTDAEEKKLVGLLKEGGYIEDMAKAMNREVNSLRGKILSMSRQDETITIPKQRNIKTKDVVDALKALGDVSNMSVAEIAAKLEKSERGVKTMLTHRGITCTDHDGKARAERIATKKEAENKDAA